jgi:hypothetical protein
MTAERLPCWLPESRTGFGRRPSTKRAKLNRQKTVILCLQSNSICGSSDRSQCLVCSTTSVTSLPRNPHSQTVATRQPMSLSASIACLSRSTLRANFSAQNPELLAGVDARLQAECRCQKQPCTKITARCLRSTRSGLPGKSLAWSRKRNPRAWSSRRRRISGRVFRARIPLIMRERVAGSTISARNKSPGSASSSLRLAA